MTDEEKQAIKDCDSIFICLDDAMSEDSANDYRKSYKILKNLIEKQSKEIEELKEQDLSNSKIIANMSTRHFNDREKIRKYEKLVDKIKAKIEDLESQIDDIKSNFDYEYDEDMANEVWRLENKIDVLQSLLEKE